MSVEETQLLIIKGILSDLPPEDRAKIEALAEELRGILKKDPDAAKIAYAMVGVETQIADA